MLYNSAKQHNPRNPVVVVGFLRFMLYNREKVLELGMEN